MILSSSSLFTHSTSTQAFLTFKTLFNTSLPGWLLIFLLLTPPRLNSCSSDSKTNLSKYTTCQMQNYNILLFAGCLNDIHHYVFDQTGTWTIYTEINRKRVEKRGIKRDKCLQCLLFDFCTVLFWFLKKREEKNLTQLFTRHLPLCSKPWLYLWQTSYFLRPNYSSLKSLLLSHSSTSLYPALP